MPQSNQNQSLNTNARLAGLLLLIVYIIGILTYQLLRGSYVFADNYVEQILSHLPSINYSIALSLLAGLLSVIVAVLLYPIFIKRNQTLAILYIVFCLINFISVFNENMAVVMLMQVAQTNAETAAFSLQESWYNYHEYSHYLYLTISVLPVTLLYYICWKYKYVASWLSILGLIACFCFMLFLLSTFFDFGSFTWAMIPMALVQLLMPIYLIVKGLY